MEATNRFIREVYLPAHNARFAKPPQIAECAFVAADAAVLSEILCVEVERVVARDNTISHRGQRSQLPAVRREDIARRRSDARFCEAHSRGRHGSRAARYRTHQNDVSTAKICQSNQSESEARGCHRPPSKTRTGRLSPPTPRLFFRAVRECRDGPPKQSKACKGSGDHLVPPRARRDRQKCQVIVRPLTDLLALMLGECGQHMHHELIGMRSDSV
jgi:hypothetical protein